MAEKEYIEREKIYQIAKKVVDAIASGNYHPGVFAYDILDWIDGLPAADVRPVVTCADCKWWTKQEVSLQGRCELLKMYPTGAWFCANGKMEES